MTELTWPQVMLARQFATKAHGEQKYAGRPYSFHLARVEDILLDFHFSTPEYIAAAWLHDVVEDTGWDIDYIKTMWGAEVAMLVWAATGVGKNRKERNKSIYLKCDLFPRGAIVKCADHICHAETSLADLDERYGSMYVSEFAGFRAAIEKHVPPAMWARLESAIEQLSCKT